MTKAEQAQSVSDPQEQMGKQKTTKIITDMESKPDGMPNIPWQHRQRQRQVRLREIEAWVLG
jgi:hypothetical protein